MREYRFRGTPDASAAFAWEEGFWVADDETGLLQFYRLEPDAEPLRTLDLPGAGKEEADWEACAVEDGDLWLCGSMGRDKKGRRRREREVLLLWQDFPKGPVRARKALVDLLAEAHREWGLDKACRHPVKDPRGLNVEGLALHPQGGLLFGLRSPLWRGQAMLLLLRNPRSVVEGGEADWGPPLLWDLGGLGIRSLENAPGGWWVLAGSPTAGDSRQLWFVPQASKPRLMLDLGPGWNGEGLAWSERHQGLLILSDDGGLFKVEKKAKNRERGRIRVLWLDEGEALPQALE